MSSTAYTASGVILFWLFRVLSGVHGGAARRMTTGASNNNFCSRRQAPLQRRVRVHGYHAPHGAQLGQVRGAREHGARGQGPTAHQGVRRCVYEECVCLTILPSHKTKGLLAHQGNWLTVCHNQDMDETRMKAAYTVLNNFCEGNTLTRISRLFEARQGGDHEPRHSHAGRLQFPAQLL